jgi:hypothetical protein
MKKQKALVFAVLAALMVVITISFSQIISAQQIDFNLAQCDSSRQFCSSCPDGNGGMINTTLVH